MKPIQTSQELSKLYNFLFWDENENLTKAQLWAMVWQEKKTKEHQGKICWHIPPGMVRPNDTLPITNAHTTKPVEIQIHFMVDEPRFFSVHLTLQPFPPTIEQLFKLGIAAMGGEMQEEDGESITGYVKSKAANQSEESIYRVYKSNNFYKVEKVHKKGEAISYELMNPESPRIKSIINKFESELTNNSLQTDLQKII